MVAEAKDLQALVVTLAGALEAAGYALFDAGMDGVGTPYDRAQLALRHPLLAKLRGKAAKSTAGRDPDATWYSMSPEQKDTVLMAAAMFPRLGSAAQQIGATGGIRTTRLYAAKPDVRATIAAMWPIEPTLRDGGYDIAIEASANHQEPTSPVNVA